MTRNRPIPVALALIVGILAAVLYGCAATNPITPGDVAGEPTVYAEVVREPDPLLLGYWRRPVAEEFVNADVFDYWLVKKGDRYAVYYFWKGHKNKRYIGWAPFVIDGDRLISKVPDSPSMFFVRDGKVYHRWADREYSHEMKRFSK